MKILGLEIMSCACLDAYHGLLHHAKAQRRKVFLNAAALNVMRAARGFMCVIQVITLIARKAFLRDRSGSSAQKEIVETTDEPCARLTTHHSPLTKESAKKEIRATTDESCARLTPHASRLTKESAQKRIEATTDEPCARLTPHASRLTKESAQKKIEATTDEPCARLTTHASPLTKEAPPQKIETTTHEPHAPLTTHRSPLTKSLAVVIGLLLISSLIPADAQQKNIIFIIADDHRYDAMGFMNKIPWLETPGLDRMAKEGMHIKNAYVTTALCSPSRASVLTGMYAHSHTVVDNTAPEPEDILYFPQLLQKKGYQTAFFGKWHMGNEGDHPRKGFHHWEGLRGQGEYYNPTLNINGKRTKFTDSTYIADLITDHALDWMKQQKKGKPFFVYLSHKGVHAMFQPAKRHKGKYEDKPVPLPPSYYLTATDEYKEHGIPEWVKDQRYSWHGVDYMYHGEIDFETFYRRYLETLLSVDESVSRVLDYLKENGLDENTLVMYMGDNGFSFGEHGLIDKRHAYEESMRVPMLVMCPSVIKAGSATEALVQNIDVGPTLLEYAGVSAPEHMQGRSFLNVLNGNATDHRDRIFYEYYWEYHYPQTPTMFAVRNGDYKYIHYYGLWTQNELYDLKNDPYEMNNLIDDPKYRALTKDLSTQVFDWLQSTDGMQIPLKRNNYPKIDHKYKGQY